MMRNMSRNMVRMDTIQQSLATGKKFLKPSDDPIGVSRSLRLNTDVSVMDQFKRNVDDAMSWLETTEKATDNIIEVLQRARELTLQGANGANTVEERKKISDEIGQLRNQLVALANSSYAGSYLFSGYKTDKPLLKEDGTYDLGGLKLSTDENINYGIGVGENLGINFIGQRVFGYANDGAVDFDKSVAESLKGRQVLNGAFVDFTTPINLDASNNQFKLNYMGTDYTIVLNEPAVYDGTPGQALSDLRADIESKLTAIAALNGKVTINQEGGRLYFTSLDPAVADNSIMLKNDSLDVKLLGFTSEKKSSSVVNSGDKTQLIGAFDKLIQDLNSDNVKGIEQALTRLSGHINNINAVRAELGVKYNRLELTSNRITDDTLNLKALLSKNEDADMSEVIMNLKMEENVYRASLAGGARIIQPSLVDFLR